MPKLLTKNQIANKKCYKAKTLKTKTKEREKRYTISFFTAPAIKIGQRKTDSFKIASREAEGWALSGNGYVSKIEWASPLGIKEINLDAISVAETRQSRISFRKHIKQKLPLKTFIYDV